MTRALIFDMDDTLVPCGVYYFNAIKQFAEEASSRTGFPADYCRKVIGSIDGLQLELDGAFTRDRFPRAFRAASLALDVFAGMPPELGLAEHAYAVGSSVFHEQYPAFDGVHETLRELRARGFTLVLNTKGDYDVQWAKIHNNQFTPLFDAIYVTLAKDTAHFQRILNELHLSASECVSIGDSMRDDIIVPTALGASTVFVSKKDPKEWKAKWAYEAVIKAPIEPTWWVRTIPEILNIEELAVPAS